VNVPERRCVARDAVIEQQLSELLDAALVRPDVRLLKECEYHRLLLHVATA